MKLTWPCLPVVGGEPWPVRRIWCVGRNYADHAREMSADPTRESPFFFTKPGDALVPAAGEVPYPPATAELHHEVELVVAVGAEMASLAPAAALRRVFGYGVGVDLTRRDLQRSAKAARQPWALAKGFDHSAPCSALRRVGEIGHPREGAIELSVNGELRQRGDLGQMIWSVGEVLSELARSVTLRPGDLLFTGTPAGVGPLQVGDRVAARIDGVGRLAFEITPCRHGPAALEVP